MIKLKIQLGFALLLLLASSAFDAHSESISAPSGTICAGTPYTYIFNPFPMQPGYNYLYFDTWEIANGSGVIATPNNDVTSITWSSGSPADLRAFYYMSPEGNPGMQIRADVMVSVTVTQITTGSAPTGPGTVCVGSYQIYNSVASKPGYVWSVTGGTVYSGQGTVQATIQWTSVGNRSVSVQYMNPTCYSTLGTLPVTVTAGPTSAVLGSNGTICAGQSTSISVAITGGASPYSFTINNYGPVSGYTSGAALNVSPSSTTTYSIAGNVTDAGGCSVAGTGSAVITVNARPTPTVPTGPISACVNTGGHVYTTQSGSGINSWVWTAPGGTINSGQGSPSISVTWDSTGPKVVSVNYTDGNGCASVVPGTRNVTVNARPTPSIPTGPISACVSTGGHIYATQSGSGINSWVWTAPGGTINSGQGSPSISVTWNSTGPQVVSVHYTDGNGCASVVPGTRNVTVNPRPTPTISPVGSTSVCVNTGGHGYTTQSGSGISGWVWTAPGGTISGQGTPSISVTWNSPGGQTVSVHYTNGNGCASLVPGTLPVTVNARPTPSIPTGDISACVNTSGHLYTTQSGSGINGWVWTAPGGTINSGQGSPSISVAWNSTGAQVVSVHYTDGNGCASVVPGTRNVTVNARPTPTAPIGPASACVNSGGHIYTSQSGSGIGGWIWTVSGGTFEGQGTPTITVTWNSTGQQQVSVHYTDGNGCASVVPGIRNVTVNPRPTPTFDGTPPVSVCKGSTGNTYETQQGKSAYQWAVSPGGQITGGGGALDFYVTVTWNTEGPQTVSVNYSNEFGCSALVLTPLPVTVKPLPSAITSIDGMKTNFTNDCIRLLVQGSADATSFNWTPQSGIIFTEAGTIVPMREVLVSSNSEGVKTVTVTPVRDGCLGTPMNVDVTYLSTALQNQVITLDKTGLAALPEGYLYINKHRCGYPCIGEYEPVMINLKLDLGDTYNFGERPFSFTANVTVTAYQEIPGVEQSWTISLATNQNSPEQLFRKELDYGDKLKYLKVKVNSYSASDAVTENFVRFVASYTENDKIDVGSATVTLYSPVIDNGRWEQSFSWTSSCVDVSNYEFQLLRLYGSEAVDWNKALRIYTESSTTSTVVAMAEGTGDYRWRVRAIGSLDDGIANPQNYGAWSTEGTFSYTHPEEGKNWIYSRTFTEGNKISEQLTYANGLQQISQQQTRIQGVDQIVATQTIQDFVGRSALTSLPVPSTGVNQNKLGFIAGLLKNGTNPFSVTDFDDTPYSAVIAADASNYYSGTNNGDNSGVADAEGYPYTRTLFMEDGTGRVKEQAGVGFAHSLFNKDKEANPSLNKKGLVQTFYSAPNEAELVMIFGKEAPDVNSVQKVVTLDANETGSVSYQTKDGKVIATALVITGSTGPLTALPTNAGATRLIADKAKSNVKIDEQTVMSRKDLIFPTTTNVTFTYKITPGQLRELCGTGSDETLVGYYPMEGNASDASGNGNDGTVTGGPPFVADNFSGKAYNFDGNDDFIQVADAPELDFGANDFTVSMWVRKKANSSNWDNTIGVNKWNTGAAPGTNEWALNLTTTGNNNIPSFSVQSGTVTYPVNATSVLTLNTWFHVAAQRTQTHIKIFVNGVQQGQFPIPAGLVVNNTGLPMLIGKLPGGFNTSAWYDELQIYRRALSPGEIQTLYQRGGPVCKTCDYTVEFKMYRPETPDVVISGLPAPQLIQGGECSQQASLIYNASFVVNGLKGKYVLEKRLRLNNTNTATQQLFIEEHKTAVRNFYNGQFTTALELIKDFIDDNNLKDLYAYLDANDNLYPFDDVNQRYVVPLGFGGTACTDYIYIDKIPLCPDETISPGPPCKMGNQEFEQWAQAELIQQALDLGLEFEPLDITGTYLSYVFFKNKYTSQKQYFLPNQLNTMMNNLIAANGGSNGMVDCEMVWNVWKEEVRNYFARGSIDMSEVTAEDRDGLEGVIILGENDLLDNFLNSMDVELQKLMTTEDICSQTGGENHFLQKTKLYGFIEGAPTLETVTTADASNVDVTKAYSLVYFDERIADMANGLRFLSESPTQPPAPTTLAMFNGLSMTACDKYRLERFTKTGDFVTDKGEANAKVIAKLRGRCRIGCEVKEEEFRQAIVNSILTVTPTARIQHYTVIIGADLKYLAYKNVESNPDDYEYSECEFDTMVEGLVQNCINNYCNTPLTLNPDGSIGTASEWDKITRAIAYDFEVQVKQSGQSCSAGYDVIPGFANQGSFADFFIESTSTPNFDVKFDSENNILCNTSLSPGGRIKFKGQSFEVQNNGSRPSLLFAKFKHDGSLLWYRHFELMSGSTQVNPETPVPSSLSDDFDLNIWDTNAASQSTNRHLSINGQPIFDVPPGTKAVIGRFNRDGNKVHLTAQSGQGSSFPKFDLSANSFLMESTPFGYKVAKRNTAGVIVWQSDTFELDTSAGTRAGWVVGVDGQGNPYILLESQTVSYNYYAKIKINGVVVATTNSYEGRLLIKINGNGTLGWYRFFGIADGPTQSSWSFIPLQNSILVFYNHAASYFDDTNSLPPIDYVTKEIGVIEIDANNTISFVDQISLSSVPYEYPMFYGNRFTLIDDKVYMLIQGYSKLVALDLIQRQFQSEDWNFPVNINGVNFILSSSEPEKFLFFAHAPNGFSYFGTPLQGTIPGSDLFVHLRYNPGCNFRPVCFRFTDPSINTPNIIVPPIDLADDVFEPVEETCQNASASVIQASIDQQKEQLIATRVQNFVNQYKSQCTDPILINDILVINYSTGLHHFTLYYYDRAGNLTKTVPPKGVVFLPVGDTTVLNTSKTGTPAHTLITEYQYNSLGQLIREHTPDANWDPTLPPADQTTYYSRPVSTSTETQFNTSRYYATYIYNDKGQLRFSRNAKQKQSTDGRYSYTKYDNLGRVTEVGEAIGYTEAAAAQNRNNNSTYPLPANTREITKTVYTLPFDMNELPPGYLQEHFRNRVSYAFTDEDGIDATTDDRIHTVYSYDPHGNVKWLVQRIVGQPDGGLPDVGIKYEYDLISGKVLRVDYNPGKADQFSHRYDYDANNRILAVYTSKNGQLWEKEANYEYYKHGPLKRTVIGEDRVQGVDYTYTIHGWLKALNHPVLDITNDPGADGTGAPAVGRDAFGMALTYFNGDYKRPGSTLHMGHPGTLLPVVGTDLYNGNIATWSSNMFYPGSLNTAYSGAALNYKQLTGYQFTYDELNRLRTHTFNHFNGSAYTSATNLYTGNEAYDANGNLSSMINYGGGTTTLDNLSYTYYGSTNRLSHVTDIAAVSTFPDDVETQSVGNYIYDPIGNLYRDIWQGDTIHWTPYGKVRRVGRSNGSKTEFMYDASGNRVLKKRTNSVGLVTTNYYVRDAGGNTMAVYEKIEPSGVAPETNLTEMHLYGSDRLGVYTKAVRVDVEGGGTALEPGEIRISTNTTKNAYESLNYLVNSGATLSLGGGFTYTAPPAVTGQTFSVRVTEGGGSIPGADGLYTRSLNNRQYELKDHLGNLRTVVNDIKLSVVSGGVPGNYEARVVNASNYYPFGLEQPSRVWNAASKYRYGFNGKEKDSNGEWGTSNYDYGFRIYNPSIGRFLSVDPLTRSYPMLTPYQFASNTPIQAIDLDGLEAFLVHGMNSTNKVWDREGFKKVQRSLLKLTNNKTVNDDFDWSQRVMGLRLNGLFQSEADRAYAGVKLAGYVLENRVKGEEITLIGVSAGGNVIYNATRILGALGHKVNVITVNTPAYNGKGEEESPIDNEGINDIIIIRTKGDLVAPSALGADWNYDQGVPGQTLEITNEFDNPKKHGTENVDVKQIDDSGLKKLKPVPKIDQ